MKKVTILIASLFLCAVSLPCLMRAETCELCKSGKDLVEGECKCTPPCDCFEKTCSCLWYGCCAEITTSEELAAQPQEETPVSPIVSEKVEIVEEPAETIITEKAVEMPAEIKPVEPAQPVKEIKKDKAKEQKPKKHRQAKKERVRKVHRLQRKDANCAYCDGKENAKKCTCSSRCSCIHKNCKCIQEGCQCGHKAIKKETQEIILQINEPYTLVLKKEGTPEKEWVVANKKLPKWFTASRTKDESDMTTYEFKATQRGRVILAMHLIGKGEKKPVQKMHFKIKVEKSKKEPAAQ